ncbi:shikimate kinase [Vulcanisaeta thermophila]|uniref:shikimate kinase n=1 Tax=Vulcanisaeta thermophila TaxID=867917 RepID=UPI000852C36F|nr:shikimate kinase [Vulcanisaeta thermophila]
MEFTTYGGISVINAVPALLGGAMAINLRVTVKIERGGPCPTNDFINFIINYTRNKLGFEPPSDLCITVDSEVPSGSGLKSNSAVATGVVYALSNYLGLGLSPVDAARVAAEATKAHGSSITGAFDDASASILCGGVLTDNGSMRVIKQFRLGDEYVVVLTGFRSGKRLANLDRLRALGGVYRELFSIALRDVWRAATLNGVLVAESLGYWDALEVIGRAISMGAVASGVSGNGPAIFAVFKREEEGPFLDFVSSRFGYYLTSGFVDVRFTV